MTGRGLSYRSDVVGAGDRLRALRAYLALTKPRIIELLLVTTLPTMFVAARHLPSGWLVATVLAGGAMAAGGANALNMVYDRDIDARMERTRHRPLVTGEIAPRAAVVFALVLEVAAFGLLWGVANLLSAVLAVGAAAFYLLVYTMWLKRSTSQNIVIGGAAGAVPVLVGWSAVTGRLGWAALLLFGIVFLWTPPHFWALAVRYQDDYRAADVPMLPSVSRLEVVTNQILLYTVAVVALSLCLPLVADLGTIYLVGAAVAGAAFIASAVNLRRDSTPRRAMRLFGSSIRYLTVIFVAMGADAVVRHP